MNINRVTFQHDREFIIFRFYFPLFMALFLLSLKAFDIYARHFEYSGSTPARDVYVGLKTRGAAIKIARETTNNQ